jgi:hypothetical protein
MPFPSDRGTAGANPLTPKDVRARPLRGTIVQMHYSNFGRSWEGASGMERSISS